MAAAEIRLGLKDRLWAGLTGACILSAALAALYFAFGRPIRSMIAARSWTPTTCEVIRSRVGGSGGPSRTGGMTDRRERSYSSDVAYRYTVGAHSYIGYRQRFLSIASNDPTDARYRVSLLPPGSKVPCWYDPLQPTDAVIDRDLDTDLMWIVFPLAVGAVGAAFLGMAIFGDWNQSAIGRKAAKARAKNEDLNAGGIFVIGLIFFVLFGLGSGMALKAYLEWRRGDGLGQSALVAFVLFAVGVRIIRYIITARRSAALRRSSATSG